MDDFYVLLSWVFAHLLLDFYLQPTSWVVDKNRRHFKSTFLYTHSFIHGLAIAIIAWMVSGSFGMALLGLALVFVSHAIIDGLKTYREPQSVIAFIVDQVAHLLVLLLVWVVLSGNWYPLFESGVPVFGVPESPDFWTLLIAFVLVLKPTSLLISMVLANRSAELAANESESLKDTGRLIGYFERVLILTFLLVDQYAAIGFLLAAKSIYRFGDLTRSEDRKLTEYVMLGSFASFTFTLAIGLIFFKWIPSLF